MGCQIDVVRPTGEPDGLRKSFRWTSYARRHAMEVDLAEHEVPGEEQGRCRGLQAPLFDPEGRLLGTVSAGEDPQRVDEAIVIEAPVCNAAVQ